MTAKEARLRQGEAAVLSVTEAARLIPGREADVRKWLRAQGLVRYLMGKPVVIWGDILDTLKADEPKPKRKRTVLRSGGLKVAG